MTCYVKQPTGVSKLLTTKTEFMRYLDTHEDVVPALRQEVREYRSLPRSIGAQASKKYYGARFGYWLRHCHLDSFHGAYAHWWLKRPHLFDSSTSNAEPEFARQTTADNALVRV